MPTAAATHIHKIAPGPAAERDGNAGAVADAETRREADTERLERGDPSAVEVRHPQLANHPADVTDLDEAGAHRQIDAGPDQQVNEDVPAEDLADRIDELRPKKVHACFLPKLGR